MKVSSKYLSLIKAVALLVLATLIISLNHETVPLYGLVIVPAILFFCGPFSYQSRNIDGKTFFYPSLLLLLFAMILEVWVVVAAAWTAMLYCWALRGWKSPRASGVRMAFLASLLWSWPVADIPQLSWYGRLLGAWAAENFYSLLSLPVVSKGTVVLVNATAIDVVDACSGIETFQIILMFGSIITVLCGGNSKWFWFVICSLPLFALLAHLLRIIVNSWIALTFESATNSGFLHDVTGLAIVAMVMFGVALLSQIGKGRVTQ